MSEPPETLLIKVRSSSRSPSAVLTLSSAVRTPWAKAAARSPPHENDSTIEFSRMTSVGAPMVGGVAADNGLFVAGLNTAVAQPASPPTAATTSIASRIIQKRISQRARWLTIGVSVDTRATVMLQLRRCAPRPACSSAALGGGSERGVGQGHGGCTAPLLRYRLQRVLRQMGQRDRSNTRTPLSTSVALSQSRWAWARRTSSRPACQSWRTVVRENS